MPARIFLSSGDLIADRRFDFARDLRLKGDLVAAADLLLQAAELAPGFATAWFTLGEVREQLGDRNGAIVAFRTAEMTDPGDRNGAGLRLMRLGASNIAGMRPTYVRPCSISTRRVSKRRWWTISAIAARRCFLPRWQSRGRRRTGR
jgi:tetratricopeptide (TPR) repeat protein